MPHLTSVVLILALHLARCTLETFQTNKWSDAYLSQIFMAASKKQLKKCWLKRNPLLRAFFRETVNHLRLMEHLTYTFRLEKDKSEIHWLKHVLYLIPNTLYWNYRHSVWDWELSHKRNIPGWHGAAVENSTIISQGCVWCRGMRLAKKAKKISLVTITVLHCLVHCWG